MICQHLGDICAATAHKQKLVEFELAFEKIAQETGVRLEPKDNPDKAFGPSKQGVVFGIEYNTTDWTWAIPQIKLHRMVRSIQSALEKEAIPAKEMKSIAGKIINIKPLFPSGKYNMDKIMKGLASSNQQDQVELDQSCKRQLHFWVVMLSACQGHLSIPRLNRPLPQWTLNIYTDAAAGTMESLGRGVGGVCHNEWFYCPWSPKVDSSSHTVNGKKVARKLSALELIGPLIAITTMAKNLFKQPVRIWVNNAGSIGAWNKGYSNSCDLCTSIITAITTIAAGIGADLQIQKITRCTTVGSILADHLSKANFTAFRNLSTTEDWPLETEPVAIPPTMLQWLHAPTTTDDLGHQLLKHIGKTIPVLGYTTNIHHHIS
jgi:hypothetical protein